MEKGRTLGKLLIGCLGCTELLIGPSLTKHTNVRDGVQFSSSKKQNMGHQTSLGLGVEVRGERGATPILCREQTNLWLSETENNIMIPHRVEASGIIN